MQSQEIQRLIQQVESKFGSMNIPAKDLQSLAVDIEDKTGEHLSESTLKRIWGYVNDKHEVRRSTLDVLSKYIGFKNYQEFLNSLNRTGTGNEGKIFKTSARKARHRWLIAAGIVIAVAILAVTAITLLLRSGKKNNGITNLSADGRYANCYVVSKPGHYCFDNRLCDSTVIKKGFTAILVWRTPEIELSNIYFDTFQIFFTLDKIGEGGNALIALRDSAGTTLWTWHIWASRKSLKEMNVSLKGDDWLDRNLGATYSPPTKSLGKIRRTAGIRLARTYGLKYEFGRPTPFPGCSFEGTDSPNCNPPFSMPCIINNEYKNYMSFEFQRDSSASIDCMIAHPLVYYELFYLDPASCMNMPPPADTISLWGGHVRNECLTVKGLPGIKLSEGKKTIYDPCPAGYRVPSQKELYRDLNPATRYDERYSTEIDGKVNGTNGKIIMNNNEYVLLPAAGSIAKPPGFSNYSLFDVGNKVEIFSSDVIIGKIDEKRTGHGADALYFEKRFFWEESTVYGDPVRCVRDSRQQ